ncbi:MAG: hypothetical protein ACRD3M_10645 [Thermoanaerobaculia bacterium]
MRSLSRLAAALVFLGLAPDVPSPLARLPQDAAGAAVRRAIEYAGGWDAWQAKKTVEFKKTTIRYRSDGSVEGQRVQTHRYVLRPGFLARIEWEEDGKKIVLINNGNQAWKLIDGQQATAQEDVNQARGATFGSHYVFCMPFKLTDPGVHLESLGREPLSDGTSADKVRVTYERGAGDAGGLHTWTYYFDSKTGRLAANHLNYAPAKYDFTEYLDDKPLEDLRLSTRRSGYNADAHGKTGPRMSESIYEDVQMNVPMLETLFARSP